MWDSSSRPSCARAATAPWTCGWSSRPLPLASVVRLLLLPVAPDLGCGVGDYNYSCGGVGVRGVCNFLGSVSSQQKFEVTNVKALGASQLSVLQLHVTAQFYLENKGKYILEV